MDLFCFFKEQLKKYDPVDYLARATSALRESKWGEALIALEGFYQCTTMPWQTVIVKKYHTHYVQVDS